MLILPILIILLFKVTAILTTGIYLNDQLWRSVSAFRSAGFHAYHNLNLTHTDLLKAKI